MMLVSDLELISATLWCIGSFDSLHFLFVLVLSQKRFLLLLTGNHILRWAHWRLMLVTNWSYMFRCKIVEREKHVWRGHLFSPWPKQKGKEANQHSWNTTVLQAFCHLVCYLNLQTNFWTWEDTLKVQRLPLPLTICVHEQTADHLQASGYLNVKWRWYLEGSHED